MGLFRLAVHGAARGWPGAGGWGLACFLKMSHFRLAVRSLGGGGWGTGDRRAFYPSLRQSIYTISDASPSQELGWTVYDKV